MTLSDEFRRMRELDGFTPQSRGQAFNNFLRRLLEIDGIPATAGITGAGETDVAFSFATRQFVVEAKWEASPCDTGTTAKLQKRLRQRLDGTVGIVVSMSGYSPDCLRDLQQGESLRVLLLDQSHVDALVGGVLTWPELLQLLIERASYQGLPTLPLESLLTGAAAPVDPVWEASTLVPDSKILRNLGSGPPFLCPIAGGGLLVQTPDAGVLSVDFDRQTLTQRLPVKNARGILSSGDGLLLIRNQGLLFSSADGLVPLLDRVPNPDFFVRGGSKVHLYSPGDDALTPMHMSGPGSIYSVDVSTRQISPEFDVGYPAFCAMNGWFASPEQLLVTGSARPHVFRPSVAEPIIIPTDASNLWGLVALRDGRFLAAGNATLSVIDISAETVRPIWELAGGALMLTSLATSEAGGLWLAGYFQPTGVDMTSQSFVIQASLSSVGL